MYGYAFIQKTPVMPLHKKRDTSLKTSRLLHKKRATSLEMAFKFTIHFTGKCDFIGNDIHT